MKFDQGERSKHKVPIWKFPAFMKRLEINDEQSAIFNVQVRQQVHNSVLKYRDYTDMVK